MWILWLGLGYIFPGMITAWLQKQPKVETEQGELNWNYFKRLVMNVLLGLGGMILLDLGSGGEPGLPALGMITLISAVLYPIKIFAQEQTEILMVYAVYFGTIFYLNPGLALVILGLVGEIFLITKDRLGAGSLFVGLIPILFMYTQFHQYFIWSATLLEVLLLFNLRYEFKERLLRQREN